jgi:signal transduction histidine kinase
MSVSRFYLDLYESPNKDTLFKTCYSYCQSILNSKSCSIYFFDDARDYLLCKYRFGDTFYPDVDYRISSKQTKSLVVRTAIENTTNIVNDIKKDERVDYEALSKLGVQSFIAIPIEISGSVQGVISFDFKNKIKFKQDMLDDINAFIKITSTILENQLLTNKVNRLDYRFKEEMEKKSIELESINRQLLLSGRLSALGQLASGVAHEIKNPLAVIKMLIATMDSEIGGESELKNDINVVKSEIMRIEEIVNHFLNFARPKTVEKKPEDINKIISEVFDFLKIKIKEKNIKLSFELYSPLKKIQVDKNQIKQVFLNIILNGIEAVKNDENGELNIKTLVVSKKSGNFLQIEVNDNGPGIDEKIISSIFEPFTTGRQDGLGLGLSICYRIISDHGGSIFAKNRLSGGAKFEINLPY